MAGSHTGAWIQDILAEDNVMFMTDNGLRLKSTPATGAVRGASSSAIPPCARSAPRTA